MKKRKKDIQITLGDLLEFYGMDRKLDNEILLKCYTDLLTYIYALNEKTCTYDYLLNYLKDYDEDDLVESTLYFYTKEWKKTKFTFQEFVENTEFNVKLLNDVIKTKRTKK